MGESRWLLMIGCLNLSRTQYINELRVLVPGHGTVLEERRDAQPKLWGLNRETERTPLMTEKKEKKGKKERKKERKERKKMLIFMSEELLDVDPYILVMTIWTYVTESFEVYVGYEPQWYLKEPPTIPIPLVEDFELVDFDPTLLYDVPPPPATGRGIGKMKLLT
ncbi:hypothetical protein CJ030_MR1G000384 [Morella rubra]|uniref:Uncharacterized protein n=1 Tax=Morella rubra TaxID=262757 RepID=A0A6A1WKH3_9ROSI|nr:hypothetical protein CJ030_MR1G000384 [Morella rubra]